MKYFELDIDGPDKVSYYKKPLKKVSMIFNPIITIFREGYKYEVDEVSFSSVEMLPVNMEYTFIDEDGSGFIVEVVNNKLIDSEILDENIIDCFDSIISRGGDVPDINNHFAEYDLNLKAMNKIERKIKWEK